MADADVIAPLIPDEVERSSFDPTPPPPEAPDRRWWGGHLREMRWQAELARLLVDPVYHGVGVPRGDGAPVMAIPGFLAGDSSLSVLLGWLRRMGYDARDAHIDFNVDCSNRSIDRLDRRLQRIHRKTGRRVALVGHSRGGHFAKALAHRHPDKVAAVISLGSGLDTAFDISIPTKFAVASVRRYLHWRDPEAQEAGCFTHTCTCRFTQDFSGKFPEEVPLTSVYSKGDGVVWWEACVVPYARCVEVTGSHVGLAANRKAYRAIADALDAARERAAPRERAAAREPATKRHRAAAAG